MAKKSKLNKNKKYILSVIAGVIAIAAIIGMVVYVNFSKTNYSFLEKRWINNNSNTVLDINIEKTNPLFANNGAGVFYDFISDLQKDISLSFDFKVGNAGTYTFKTVVEPKNNDLVFYEDHYVVVSKSATPLKSIDELKGQTIGVLTSDLANVSYYLSDTNGLSFSTYEDINKIKEAMNNTITYAIIPLYENIDTIIYQTYNVVYHMEDLNIYFVLNMPETDSELNNVFNKFYLRWKEKSATKFNEHFLNLYYDAKKLTELQKESIVSDDYIVGYVNNLPYEGKINGKFNGLTNGYLDKFALLTGATYKYVEYQNTDKLSNALKTKKVDIVFNNGSLADASYASSNTLGNVEYVVVANRNNDLTINNLQGLKGKTVKLIGETSLSKTLISKSIFKAEEVKNTKELYKENDESTILILEKYVYDYYKDNKLKDYSVRYTGKTNTNNTFLLNKDNAAFNNLFNFYLSILSGKEVEYYAVNLSLDELNSNVVWNFIVKNISYITIVVVALSYLIYRYNRKVQVVKKIKKEDRMLYLDVLTNLKNRNYLNDNIEYWEENKVFPQAIITLDICGLKDLNDRYGHEEGDAQLKAVSNILIKTQRENSEIIRSDGDEFLIYLVGYDEKAITTYIHKLNKEFNDLPYQSGVVIGYSIINDELKTIDDAINESIEMMKENKDLQK